MAGRKSETGGSAISNILWFFGLGMAGYALWNVAPIYMDHYSLKDKVAEIARLPRGGNTDEQILTRLMKEVRERGLSDYIQASNCTIRTLENSRQIKCEYVRVGKVFPGKKSTFNMSLDVDSPILF